MNSDLEVMWGVGCLISYKPEGVEGAWGVLGLEGVRVCHRGLFVSEVFLCLWSVPIVVLVTVGVVGCYCGLHVGGWYRLGLFVLEFGWELM